MRCIKHNNHVEAASCYRRTNHGSGVAGQPGNGCCNALRKTTIAPAHPACFRGRLTLTFTPSGAVGTSARKTSASHWLGDIAVAMTTCCLSVLEKHGGYGRLSFFCGVRLKR